MVGPLTVTIHYKIDAAVLLLLTKSVLMATTTTLIDKNVNTRNPWFSIVHVSSSTRHILEIIWWKDIICIVNVKWKGRVGFYHFSWEATVLNLLYWNKETSWWEEQHSQNPLECRLCDENCCWFHQQNIYAVNQKLTHFDDLNIKKVSTPQQFQFQKTFFQNLTFLILKMRFAY